MKPHLFENPNDTVLCAAQTGVNESFCKRLLFGGKKKSRENFRRKNFCSKWSRYEEVQRSLFPSQLYFLSFLRVFNSHIFSLLYTFPLIAILDREFYLVVRPTEIADIFTFRHFQKKNCVASRYTLNCLQISGNKTCRGHDAAAEKTDKFSFSRKRFRTVYFLRRFRKDVTLSVWNHVRVKYRGGTPRKFG